MWGSTLDGDRLRRTESGLQSYQWHRNTVRPEPGLHSPAAVDRHGSNSSEESSDRGNEGTWGESDVGGFNERSAVHEYEALKGNLLQLQRTGSRASQASKSAAELARRGSRGTTTEHGLTRSSTPAADTNPESQPTDADRGPENEDDFQLADFMRQGYFEKRTEDGSEKKVGVIYRDLTVKGTGSTTSFVRTVPDAIIGTFGPDLYHSLCRLLPFLKIGHTETRNLLHGFTGCVRDGEMMLVLGRPGAGCSTFLKAVSNNTESFAAVDGEVSYGGIPRGKQKNMYRGEVNYNGEDDIHFAPLSVWQTLTFALKNKTRKKCRDDIPVVANALMRMFGISHTKYTQVGDEYTRGVSGGERKRVSIAETLASKSTVMTWDNSTRGLDASTALDYARSLRIMTDISNRTTLVTLYQAGEGIYDLVDKVLVIDQGREIFSGPAEDAKQYFIDLGFECPERQTTADFLTAVTDPVERRFRPGFENKAPRTAEEFEKVFRGSPSYAKLLADVEDYEQHLHRTDFDDAKRFEGAVQESKSKTVRKKSPYTVSFIRQVWACTEREFWLLFGDLTTLWTKLFIIVSNGLIVGSIFYGQPLSTEGAFTRGGALFFSILFLGWLQLSELMKAVSGRVVVARHKDYAFYRPSAVAVARVIQDFPVIAVQVCIFGLIMYFMTSLDVDAGKFWIYMLFVYVTTINLTALYRMFASLSPEIDTAVRFSGIALNLLVIYTGYVIPKTQLLTNYIWFGWLVSSPVVVQNHDSIVALADTKFRSIG